MMEESSQSSQPPQSQKSYDNIYETQYSYIGDNKEDEAYWQSLYGDNYKHKYYRCKKYGYFFFFTMIVGMLLSIAIPDMYEGYNKDIHIFKYGRRITNILVPNSYYYNNSTTNLNPTELSIVWYSFTAICLMSIVCIYRLTPKY